jgi:hypothetical protein
MAEWTDEPVGLREGITVECPLFCGKRCFFSPHTDQATIDAEVQRHIEQEHPSSSPSSSSPSSQ